jgi:hypothetical protein
MSTHCQVCGHNNGLEESLQGTLGGRAQLRCRCCGSWWSIPVGDLDMPADPWFDEDE